MNGGELIKQKRIQLSLSQQDVADACGVSKSTVCKWQSGNISNMRRDRINALARILKISPMDIVNSESTQERTMTLEQQVLVDCFRQLNGSQKTIVLQLVKSMIEGS